jgi:Tsi6
MAGGGVVGGDQRGPADGPSAPGGEPGFSIYLSIQRQLEYLQETMAAGAIPSDEKRDSPTLGVYAAREFETPDRISLTFFLSQISG